jgi:hypothetical protein
VRVLLEELLKREQKEHSVLLELPLVHVPFPLVSKLHMLHFHFSKANFAPEVFAQQELELVLKV